MIVQSVILADPVCADEELYIRGEGLYYVKADELIIGEASRVSIDTYMNILDADFWQEHTYIENWCFNAQVKGRGEIRINTVSEGEELPVKSIRFDESDWADVHIPFSAVKGQVFAAVFAEKNASIRKMTYSSRC